MTTPTEIEPDTKDWTWVLERPCDECGFDPRAVDVADLGRLILANAEGWQPVLASAQAAQRPTPTTWSPTEYAAHVRDVHRMFFGRVNLMLAEDDPVFANWDQDETALAERYDLQVPAEVAAGLSIAAGEVAAAYDAVLDDAWSRRGTRSNGSEFTVETIGIYHLHDVVHHLWDVRWVAGAQADGGMAG
ncbi:DinB family protein [Nocardioides humilatus]|uniref:DinB family protein n=1 Tax=Nocardioides humilatus TaxID=2607660 RepID=A0A5B1L8X8_9ACTN|nr:DinB family protein [Nocardioides humilatus]KAA1417045.1 DinB family protein [Nocardioides humilatus]